jgi:adenylate kinase
VCSNCGASYHTEHNPSQDGVNCDKCNSALTTRVDDAPEVVKSRLEVYHKTTEPLKAYYKDKGNLELVDGVGTVEEITARTFASIGV